LISFEGMDGAGKSSHIQEVVAVLEENGFPVLRTREPGGTPLGEHLRALLLNEPMDLETEALLMFAARREHVVKVIEPALSKGVTVVTDRFADASFAYQSSARGMPWGRMASLESWVLNGLKPDLTFLFDLPPDVAAKRTASRGPEDKFEKEPEAFHQAVREGYLRRLAEDPRRFEVIDAVADFASVSREVLLAFEKRLNEWRR
jgi:dTMP kinase